MPQISEPKRLKQSRVQSTVTFSMEETLAAEGKTLQRLSESVRIDGFRPGKAPMDMVRQKVPDAALLEEVVRDLLPSVFQSLITEHKLAPVIPPKVDVQKRTPLEIIVTVIERPEVKLKGVEKIKIEKKAPAFDEKDVQRMVDYLLAQYRTFTPADRAAAKDDQVTLDFVGTDAEGKEIAGTRATGYQVVIGSASLIPGFEDNLIGLKAGDEKSFTLTFPTDYHAEQLKGKPVTFAVTVKGIAAVNTPALTDAFVKEHNLGESEADMRKRIRDSMTAQEESGERQRREKELFDALLKAVQIELPEELLAYEQRLMFEEIERQLSQEQQSFEEWMKRTKRTPETLQKELKEEAQKRLTLRYGIDALVTEKKIEVSDDEMQKAIADMRASAPPEEVVGLVKGSEQYDELRWRRKVEKLIEMMLGA